jgi:hypothetical protein
MMASTLPSQCHMPATAVSSTVTAAMVAFAALSGAARLAAQSPGEIRGTITLITADGTLLAAAGAQVTLRCTNGDIVKFGTADDDGVFRFGELPLDTCSVETELQGFESVTVTVATTPGAVASLALRLETTPLRTGVLVTERPGSVCSTAQRKRPRRPLSRATHACNQSVGMRAKHRRAVTGAHPSAVR